MSGNMWTGSCDATLQCPSVGQTIFPISFEFTLTGDNTLIGDGPEVWTRTRP